MISTLITILRMREPPKKTCIIMAVSSKPGSANKSEMTARMIARKRPQFYIDQTP